MAEKNIYSVSQVNSYLGHLFREDFVLRRIRVRGELSNVKYHSSGHIYFTMKDQGGTLAAVMFAGQRRGLSFELREGLKVVVTGSVEVYERGGVYQLYASSIEEEGRGDLYAEFLRLKRELEEMGMFAPEYKKPIPKYVSSVGIVTARTGAAIRDIINVSTRRDPYIRLVLYPATVQGERAADSIVRGIRTLDRYGVDVIICGRGGGSIEDLWAFNEERVARAIFECETPVISAVGHEIDVVLSDFAADLRAPTPSAAAEVVSRESENVIGRILECSQSIKNEMLARLDRASLVMKNCSKDNLKRSMEGFLDDLHQRLDDEKDDLIRGTRDILKETRHSLELASESLKASSPETILKRGYAAVYNRSTDQYAGSAASIKAGNRLKITFWDGTAAAVAEKKGEEV